MCSPERCFNVIIALLLLLTCDTAFTAPDFEACGDIPDDQIDIPGGVKFLHLHASGTRNYTCSLPGGPAIIGDNQGAVLAQFHPEGKDNETAGFSYATADDRVVMIVDYSLGGLSGKAETNTSVAGPLGTSPIFQPSPRNDSIPWARWRVLDSGGSRMLENVTYITRFDTEGGEKPENCPPGKTSAEVPFKAAYMFYTCAQSGGLLNAAGCLASAVVWTSLGSILLAILP